MNLQDWKNFARWQGLGGTLDVMWDVEKAGVFTPPCAVVDCSKVERSGLAEGWEAKLDLLRESVVDVNPRDSNGSPPTPLDGSGHVPRGTVICGGAPRRRLAAVIRSGD